MAVSKTTRVTIVIPTYDEKENIQDLVEQILSLDLDWDPALVIVDDDSPDGTGEIVTSLAQENTSLHPLIRRGKRGRGSAGIEGFRQALELNPDFIIEMDADFSHRPEEIPRLLEEAPHWDLVIGSRFIPGGKDIDRNLLRKFITFIVRHFLSNYLKIPVKDITSGFRCFQRDVLERIELDSLKSQGPSLVQEVLFRAVHTGCRIKEVPITFSNRKKGKTKLSFPILLDTLIFNWKLRRSSW